MHDYMCMIVYVYIYIYLLYNGAYKPTYNWGASHCVYGDDIFSMMVNPHIYDGLIHIRCNMDVGD